MNHRTLAAALLACFVALAPAFAQEAASEEDVFGQEEEHGFLPGGGRGAALGLRRLRAALAEPGPGEDRRAAQAFAQFFTLSPWTS